MNRKSPKDRIIMALNDETLDRATGGARPTEDIPRCPLCMTPANNGICDNLQCRNYGSYIAYF